MALGHEVDLHPGVYQEPPPDVADRDVIIVDFSYKRPVFEEMAAKATSLLVLDHHKTAAEDLQGFRSPFGNGWPRHLDNIYQDMCEGCGGVPYALFDMDRSGAGLAWDFFFKAPRPKLIDHIEDRDLWRFALPKTREIAAAVFSYPYDLDLWSGLMADEGSILARLAIEGEAIERKHHQDIANLLPVVQREMVLGGMRMPVACLPLTFTSDAGHTMAVAADGVAACYWDTPAGRVFSLRSTDSGPDVSLIAKKYGGGGHHHAAGFRAAIGWEGE
jgi:oligoribonuclease NrnB/cAMP/cGMP phosphodiesterase (DHH superfamily)